MGYRHSGVKIYKTTERKQKDRRSLSLSVVQMLTVCIVMIFWWNAVLEVFHIPFDRAWLRGGTAAAVLLLGAADRMGKGKAVPAVLAALAVCLWLGWGTIVELCSWMVQNYDTLLSAQPEGEPVFSCAAVLLTVPVLEGEIPGRTDPLRAVYRRGLRGTVPDCPHFVAADPGSRRIFRIGSAGSGKKSLCMAERPSGSGSLLRPGVSLFSCREIPGYREDG